MLILSLALLTKECKPYQKLNELGFCVHICLLAHDIFDIEKQKCVPCKLFGGFTRNNANACACREGYGFVNEKCTKCRADWIKPGVINDICTICEAYEESNANRTQCFNKCSEMGQKMNIVLTDEGVCQNCSRNMFVKDNQCHCVAGFVEEVHMSGVECVQEKGTAKVKKQSEAVAMGILIVIFALHAVGITWFVVNKIFRAKMNKLQGIKSA